MRIAVLKVLGPRPTNAVDAEASILIMATKRLAVTPKVTNFGVRCAVVVEKNFLIEPMYMRYIFVVSNHRPGYEPSTASQFGWLYRQFTSSR
jgi:hypothetical protein